MNHPRIKRDPKVMLGNPVILGTRITVEHILLCLGAGDSIQHILAKMGIPFTHDPLVF